MRTEAKLPEKTDYWWDVQTSNRFGDYIEGYNKMAIDRSIELISPLREKKVLDFGCGSGNWSVYLTRYEFKPIGVDIDKNAVRIYQERIPGSKAILAAQGSERLPLKNDAVDLIIVISLSQMFACDWFLKEAARVLKPNGVVVGTLQNKVSWRGMLQRAKSVLLKTENPFKLSFSELKERAHHEEFEIIFSRGFGWIPVFSRQNNSVSIPVFAFLERLFLLGYVRTLSSNVVFVLRRRT